MIRSYESDGGEATHSATSSSTSDSGPTEAAELLISMIADAAQLDVLLNELDEKEFQALKRRLEKLHSMICDLPFGPRPQVKIGFKSQRKVRPMKRNGM